MLRKRRKSSSDYVAWVIIIIIWCLMIMTAGQVDVAYHEHKALGPFVWIADQMVEWGHRKGITFAFLYNSLGGYSSVLLAVLGMIVTGWINISNRMEQKVYGFRRKELFPLANIVTNLFAGVFCTPAWMVYALIHQYCFMAYCIMGMIFVQFLVSNVLLAVTYNNNHDYNSLTRKIQQSLKKINSMKDFGQYDLILDRIADSIDDAANWKELNQMFLDVLSGYKETKECLKIYKFSHSFVSKVFGVREERIVELLILYTREINQNRLLSSMEKRVYWVLLDCMYEYCSEEQINHYLDWLFDEMVLDNTVTDKENYFRIEDIEDIFSMVVLQTECWLQENDSKLEQFGGKLDRIFRLGSRQYTCTDQGLLRDLICERDVVMKGYSGVHHRCYERLMNSYSADRKQIHMGSLIESVAHIYKIHIRK